MLFDLLRKISFLCRCPEWINNLYFLRGHVYNNFC